MPGPVSDSYEPEFGTGANVDAIKTALREVYSEVSDILDGAPPMYILDLVRTDLPILIPASLTERQWRLIRFAP